jgi:hypothetical protein
MDPIQWVTLVIIAILLIIDIVTTTIGIKNKKLPEKGIVMKYAADNIFLHIVIKLVVLVIAGLVLTFTQSVWLLFWPIAVLVIVYYAWVCYNNYNLISRK